MHNRFWGLTLPICGAIVAAGAWLTSGGDLTPPPGPIAPTMKPLDQVEPRTAISQATTPGDATSVFRIAAPGSYYLTANLAGEAGKNGITVNINEAVTIDLNGFSLIGVPGSLNGLNAGGYVTVRNGSFEAWGGSGLFMGQAIVDGVRANFNGQNGIRATWGSLITNCTTESNNANGISVADVSRISGCISKGNSGRGIALDGACIVSDCVLYNNDGGGIFGGLATIRDNKFFSNQGFSIELTGFGVVTGNYISAGAGAAIFTAGQRSRIAGNTIVLGTTGIQVTGTDNLITNNSVQGAATPFNIAAGNAVGPIVTVSGAGDLSAVTGADHPLANLVY
jgi:hypothetical protein